CRWPAPPRSMPELPEVETTARGLRSRLVGRRVRDVTGVDWPRMLPQTSEGELRAVLSGLGVREVDRRGKFLLIGFDEDCWLAIHRKMSGNLLLRPTQAPPEPHTHLDITFDDGSHLRLVDARKFGRVYLFRSSHEREAFIATRLGPEPLTQLDARSLGRMLRGRRGRIKPLLLDQAFLAGLGNLYADEALWEARIHPARAADSLTRVEVARLALAIRQVLLLGIERRGTSFSSYRDAEDAPGENQDFLNAYGRASQPCPRCGTPISRTLIGMRSAHFCAHCQHPSPPIRRRVASGSAPLT
ncbi:MAG: bifunctional DNA-formamidopyrimidine glycosylase/DNA-(apurinic or apyrimidinic site) lyase, partial [Chloroflexota bacterium]|nr:bifunctional DNA-formamidopyrimidine glycosylase/DNA-(apurinic or apyrimidinic site) lyase [Chloroflexota bacterium]